MIHQIAGNATSTMAWCTCNQGFSGHNADGRLAEHIANPVADGFGALLSEVMMTGGWDRD